MKGSIFTGFLREEGRRSLEDLDVLLQPAVLSAQPDQLVPLHRGRSRPLAVIDVGLPNPLPHRRLSQVEVPGHLADRAVPAVALLDDVGLEPRRDERRRRCFFFATVSMMGILSGAEPLIVDVRQTGSAPEVSPTR